MQSMTGQGRGECAQKGFKVTVEATSVNRKQGDVAVALPRELDSLENDVRGEVHRYVSRGRVNVRVSLHLADGVSTVHVRVNTPLARAYARELKRLARELGLEGGVALETLVRAPGVLLAEDDWDGGRRLWPLVKKALGQAMTALVKMRAREGAHLVKDLRKRIALICKCVGRVQRRAPAVTRRYREQLRERIRDAGLELPDLDDDRMLKEVAYFADRSDISEELTRLQSHFAQFEDCVKATDPVGRKLDFLVQEMNREVNTIGSKANDSQISREVVTLKTELERFREQVQNVE